MRSAPLPDHSGVLQQKLGQEKLLGNVGVIASASETDRKKKTLPDLTDLAKAAAHKATDTWIENRHMGGGEDSIAYRLPRWETPVMLVLADVSLSLWEFGLGEKRTHPPLLARVPRAEVASVSDTGKCTARGHIRLSFTDGSFIDYPTAATPSEEF